MNQRCITKNWNQFNGKAKARIRRPADGGLLIIKGRHAPKRPNRAIDDPSPFARSIHGRPVNETWPGGTPQPLRVEDQRRALLALRARLQGNLVRPAETALSGGIETTVAAPDTVDCATDVIEQNVAVSLLGSVSRILDQIETALQRVDEGTYGRCLECDARIPAARLQAVPYATCCVQCAARQERIA
jgi:DnaK suppressor protein